LNEADVWRRNESSVNRKRKQWWFKEELKKSLQDFKTGGTSIKTQNPRGEKIENAFNRKKKPGGPKPLTIQGLHIKKRLWVAANPHLRPEKDWTKKIWVQTREKENEYHFLGSVTKKNIKEREKSLVGKKSWGKR